MFLHHHSKISWWVIDLFHLISNSLMNLEFYDCEPHIGICMLDQNSFVFLLIIWFYKFQILLFFFSCSFLKYNMWYLHFFFANHNTRWTVTQVTITLGESSDVSRYLISFCDKLMALHYVIIWFFIVD